MSGHISPVLSESFEDVLNAVQETARGRWFLEEYATRKKSEDTTAILAAIVKLESVMARVPEADRDAEPALLDMAKSAIIRAKAQIRSMAPKDSPLSREAMLFAKLADLSRTAFNASNDDEGQQALGRSMEVALRLVNELDQTIIGAEATAEPHIGQKFFHQDSDIFEPAPKTEKNLAPEITEVQVSERSVAKSDPIQRGAKLTITRAHSSESSEPIIEPAINLDSDTMVIPTAPAAPPADMAPPKPAPVHAEKPQDPETKTEQRIVIVRRKPDDSIDVPLFDTQDNASAA
jgi:hypothetical protein